MMAPRWLIVLAVFAFANAVGYNLSCSELMALIMPPGTVLPVCPDPSS